ncbi:MAG: hypothetical protein IKA47_03070, partial [Oscillospiraceae bacterium]|nr:hypothetical protein [Oscillospiraceae bacterium]
LTQNGNLVLIRYQIPAEAQSGEYTLSVTPDLENCFYYNVDSNGYIAFGTGNTKQVPATQSLTVNVTGTEPAGTACPEHTEVTTWTDVAEGTWTGGAIAEGHYKLTGNQTLTSALTVAGNVCIDLAGYNITVAAHNIKTTVRAFENSGNLTILDTAETDGVISGGSVWVTGATEAQGGNIYNTGTFNLYGGTISGGIATTDGGYAPVSIGGNIYGAAGSIINIKGGTVTGGWSKKEGSYTKNPIGGGNIGSDGTVNISGGVISDGYTSLSYTNAYSNRYLYAYGGNIRVRDGVLNISGGTISGGYLTGTRTDTSIAEDYTGGVTAYGYGGNIYAIGTAVTISGGTITEGKIDVHAVGAATGTSLPAKTNAFGGNLYVEGGSCTISGGTISDGLLTSTAAAHANNTSSKLPELNACGANVYVTANTAVTMTAGTITGGQGTIGGLENDVMTMYVYGGNVYVASGGSFTMSGGEVSDGMAYYRGGNFCTSGELTLSGTAVVKGGYTASYSTACAGNNVAVIGGNAVLTINDNAQLIEGELPEGNTINSAIYAITNGDIVINGGKVEGEVWAAGTTSNPNATLTINGGEVGTFGKGAVVPAANVVVGNGVITKTAPHTYMTGEAAVLAGEKYTTYATLADALAAAQADSTVSLAKDATAGAVAVPAGVTLDLNGKTLTADSVTAAFNGTHVVDSKGTGKIDSDSVSVMSNNKQLAVHHEGNVTLETVELAEDLAINGTTGL